MRYVRDRECFKPIHSDAFDTAVAHAHTAPACDRFPASARKPDMSNSGHLPSGVSFSDVTCAPAQPIVMWLFTVVHPLSPVLELKLFLIQTHLYVLSSTTRRML